jgi:hypothetical protein
MGSLEGVRGGVIKWLPVTFSFHGRSAAPTAVESASDKITAERKCFTTEDEVEVLSVLIIFI